MPCHCANIEEKKRDMEVEKLYVESMIFLIENRDNESLRQDLHNRLLNRLDEIDTNLVNLDFLKE